MAQVDIEQEEQIKKIVLDVDGVLLNFMPAFDKAAEQVIGRKVIPAKDEFGHHIYDLEKRVGVTSEVKEKILQHMIDTKMYANLDSLDGAKEALVAIRAMGFKIYVVTALPESAKELRLHNLKEALDFVPDEIHCVGMGMSKKEKINEIKPHIFIDDRNEYLSSVSEVYHLALVDQLEEQKLKDSMVDCMVRSLNQWVNEHLPRVVKKLNRHIEEGLPLQYPLKLASPEGKHNFEGQKQKMKLK